MPHGIERIDLYAGRLCTDALAIAEARGRSRAYAEQTVMVGTRSVLPPYEDAVTLAVNAGRRLLAGGGRDDIGLLVVGTESSVDYGKPVSTWVHRFLQLPAECRSFEVKHACYGGTAALRVALAMVAGGMTAGKKALVISADFSRPALKEGGGFDFIGGASAVAMLVGRAPRVLEVPLDRAGAWTHEIADTFRPTARLEVADNEASLCSYLDALEGAWDAYQAVTGGDTGLGAFQRHIYHAPFPGMTLRAHRALMAAAAGGEAPPATEVQASFEEKVLPGLRFARRIGSAYGASCFVSLLGHLASDRPPRAGDRLSLFAYGSGCQGELYEARVGPEAAAEVRAREIDAQLAERLEVSLEQYERLHAQREDGIDRPDWTPPRDELFGARYAGRELLVLGSVNDFRREYEWS